MKTLLPSLILLSFIFPSFALASTQVLVGRSVAGTTATQFIPLNGMQTTTGTSNNQRSVGVWPIAGTFKTLRVYTNAAPGGTATWTVALNDNSTNEAVTCTITSAATSCSDTTHTYTPTAGTSLMSVKFIAANAPVSAVLYFTIDFTPTTPNETAIISNTGFSNLSTIIDQSIPFGVNDLNATESSANIPAPEAGVLDNLYAKVNSTPGVGKSYAFTFRQNTASTTQTCSITDANSTCSDTTDAVTIAAGDLLNIRHDPVATPVANSVGFGNRFVPTVAGDFDMSGTNSAGIDSTTLTSYEPMTGALSTNTAIEASTTEYADASQVKGFRVHLKSATGPGKSRTFTLRKNNANTGCALTITSGTDGSTTCSPAISFAVGDTWDYSDTPTGSPAATQVMIGTILSMPPGPKHHVWGGFFRLRGGFFKLMRYPPTKQQPTPPHPIPRQQLTLNNRNLHSP